VIAANSSSGNKENFLRSSQSSDDDFLLDTPANKLNSTVKAGPTATAAGKKASKKPTAAAAAKAASAAKAATAKGPRSLFTTTPQK
jgi:hypothetical protein